MHIQAMTRLFISTARPAAPRQARLRFAIAAIALCAVAHAQLPVQQLTVAFTNASPNASIDTLTMPNNAAAIMAVNPLLTNGTSHSPDLANLYTALVWVTNPATSTLDVIYADAEQHKIWRLPGPSYKNPVAIFSWSSKSPGPPCPVGLAADPNSNVYVISASCLWGKAGVWVLPITAAGGYGAPLLIDNTFTDPATHKPVLTLALAEVLLAGSAATGAVPAWSGGDLLVLVADLLSTRVIRYTQAQINSVLTTVSLQPKGLSGPASTVVTQAQFSTQALTVKKIKIPPVPIGVDIEQDPNTRDMTLLLSTADGRILDFDSATNAFITPYAINLGLGLTRLKVGTFQARPYVFVGQLPGRILEFAAPASGASNTLTTKVASVSTGVNNPAGLSVTYSASTVASKCINTPGGCPITPQFALLFTGSGTTAIPPTAPIVVDSCTFVDTRVTFAGQCPVATTLDLGAKCPNMPHIMLPTNICGAWGATGEGSIGASINAAKVGASAVNQDINNTFTSFLLNPDLVLPGSNPGCGAPNGPIAAWAPLPGVESPIPEGNALIDITVACTPDPPPKGGGSHASVLLQGTVNAPLTALYIDGEFANLQTAFTDITTGSAPTLPPPPPIGSQIVDTNPPTIVPAIQGYITQSQSYFDQQNYNGALNTLWAGVQYVNSLATNSPADFIAGTPPYDQNPSGTLLSRLDHLYYDVYIFGGIACTGQSPPPLTTDALNLPAPTPVCAPTITGFTVVDSHDTPPSLDPTATFYIIPAGSYDYLVWATTNLGSGTCTLTTTDGLYTNAAEPANSVWVFTDNPVGSSPVPFNPPYNQGNLSTATLTCGVPPNTASSSFNYVVTPGAITVSLNPTGVGGGQSTQITWIPPSGATGCTLTSNGQGTPTNPIATDNGPTTGAPEPVATYNSVEADAETNNSIVTITATCTAGASPASTSAQLFVSE
jgi:hypothetical protein